MKSLLTFLFYLQGELHFTNYYKNFILNLKHGDEINSLLLDTEEVVLWRRNDLKSIKKYRIEGRKI
nr:unnamed protein product [Callosobruchus chinensis]